MGQEQNDLMAAVAIARMLLRRLEEGVPALIATDEFRTQLADLCEKLERRLEEISSPK
jgi:DNA-binding Xre family transcriptional regulator